MKDNELSIILPIFNEEAVIQKVIEDIHECTAALIGDVEIIAVNDASTDATITILTQLQKRIPNLKVISNPINGGVGYASCCGIKNAVKKWVLLMDSDGQFSIDSLKVLWPHRDRYDLLLGFREKRADHWSRLVLGAMGRMISNVLLGRKMIDINCGFKIFKREFLIDLPLSCQGGAINFEIFYYLFRKFPQIKIRQEAIEHYPRQAGKATGGSRWFVLNNIVEVMRVFIKSYV